MTQLLIKQFSQDFSVELLQIAIILVKLDLDLIIRDFSRLTRRRNKFDLAAL